MVENKRKRAAWAAENLERCAMAAARAGHRSAASLWARAAELYRAAGEYGLAQDAARCARMLGAEVAS